MQTLKVISDGTTDGTKLVDAATGERFALDGAQVACDIAADPHGGTAEVVIRLCVPVEVTGTIDHPFRFIGHRG